MLRSIHENLFPILLIFRNFLKMNFKYRIHLHPGQNSIPIPACGLQFYSHTPHRQLRCWQGKVVNSLKLILNVSIGKEKQNDEAYIDRTELLITYRLIIHQMYPLMHCSAMHVDLMASLTMHHNLKV